ncbi:MAG TPA: hypothetical protein VK020_13430 [Microlunatus sp.]|nr:hypothetical protein [Microlunatus sp.]
MTAATRLSRAAGLALGYLAGRFLDRPVRRRPVAAFEQAAAAVEDRTYADDANWGTVHTAGLVGGAAALGLVVEKLTRKRPLLHALATAAAAAAVLDGDADERPARSVVGALLWGGGFGIPGLLGYRAARSVADQLGNGDERYAEFGRSAVQLGEFVDWVPNQVTEKLSEATDAGDGTGADAQQVELGALALAAAVAIARSR